MAAKHTIAFLTGIESISRKFAPRHETCANVSSTNKIRYKWLGSGVRFGATKELDTHSTNFLVVRKNPRTSPVSAKEIAARVKFSTVRQNVYDRMIDLSSIAADQAAFKAQKDTAGGVKSFYAYIWKLEVIKYNQLHPQS